MKLEEIESRAAEAEARAERAERLAMLKAEEAERTRRLREILDRIAAAEQRANAAEERARAAVDRVSEPFEPLGPGRAPRAAGPPSSPSPPLEVEPRVEPEDLAPAPAESEASAPVAASEGPLSINDATYEDLRALGLSVTQAGRVLARRERTGPFSSVDELDLIPGFGSDFLDELKPRLRT